MESYLRAEYDKYGNATSYYLSRNKNRRRAGAPINIKIKNQYDKRKLLLNRFFYNCDEAGEIEVLTKIERYIYDQQPLVFSYKKGDIIEDTDMRAF